MTEATGIVLGILPLAIEVAKRYKWMYKVFSRYKNCGSEVTEFQRRLHVEQTSFRNEVQILLAGATNFVTANKLLGREDDPLVSDFEEDEKLAHHLGEFGAACGGIIEKIDSKLSFLETFLEKAIPGESKQDLIKRTRRKLRFSFAESHLESNLADLSKLNADFFRISSHINRVKHLQTDAGPVVTAQRSKYRVDQYDAVRKAAVQLFEALGEACSIHPEHWVQLQLDPGYTPAANGEPTLIRFIMSFTQSSVANGTTEVAPAWIVIESILGKSLADEPPEHREEVQHALSHLKMTLKREIDPPPPPPTNKVNPKKGVKFVSPEPESRPKLYQNPVSQDLEPPLPNFSQDHNLCIIQQSLSAKKETPNICIGYLRRGDSCEHRVFSNSNVVATQLSKSMSLAQLIDLDSHRSDSRMLLQYESLKLARQLASAVLQFHDTPFMKSSWCSDDVIFFGINETRQHLISMSPCLNVQVKDTSISSYLPTNTLSRGAPTGNPYLFGLGIILIELAYQVPFRSLREEEDLVNGQEDQYTDFRTAERVAWSVGNVLGATYGAIVRKCLFCNFGEGTHDLRDLRLQHAFYRDVLCKLENLEDQMRSLQVGVDFDVKETQSEAALPGQSIIPTIDPRMIHAEQDTQDFVPTALPQSVESNTSIAEFVTAQYDEASTEIESQYTSLTGVIRTALAHKDSSNLCPEVAIALDDLLLRLEVWVDEISSDEKQELGKGLGTIDFSNAKVKRTMAEAFRILSQRIDTLLEWQEEYRIALQTNNSGSLVPDRETIEGLFDAFEIFNDLSEIIRSQAAHAVTSERITKTLVSQAAIKNRKDESDLLEQWIDGTSLESTFSEREGWDVTSSGFAWHSYETCLKLLKSSIQASKDTDGHTVFESKPFKECLNRLFLWGDGFRGGQLDKIIQRSDALKSTILQFIAAISNILLDELLPQLRLSSMPPEISEVTKELRPLVEKVQSMATDGLDDSDEDYNDSKCDAASVVSSPSGLQQNTVKNIDSYVSCLMGLLPTMEHTLNVHEEPDSTSSPVEFHVSDAARVYVRHVRDKFKNADTKLVSRLGEANLQRHTAIRQKMAQKEELIGHDVEQTPKSVFMPTSIFHDSGLGSMPTMSNLVPTIASHSSFKTDGSQGSKSSFRVPEAPAGAYEGAPFPCVICGHILKNIKNRYDWKIHFFADLQPYICTFSECADSLRTFPTRKLWQEHEFSQHRSETSWSCPYCEVESSSADAWKDHVETNHKDSLANVETRYAFAAAKRTRVQPIELQKCPLCLENPGTSQEAFTAHVCRHLESIALAVLPKDISSDSEAESVSDQLSIRSNPRPSSEYYPEEHAGTNLLRGDPKDPKYVNLNVIQEKVHNECVSLSSAIRRAKRDDPDEVQDLETQLSEKKKQHEISKLDIELYLARLDFAKGSSSENMKLVDNVKNKRDIVLKTLPKDETTESLLKDLESAITIGFNASNSSAGGR